MDQIQNERLPFISDAISRFQKGGVFALTPFTRILDRFVYTRLRRSVNITIMSAMAREGLHVNGLHSVVRIYFFLVNPVNTPT